MNAIQEREALAAEAATVLFTTPAVHGAQLMMEAHSAVIAGAQGMMEDWLRRRHEAIADARRLMERLWECGDAAAIWQAHDEWLRRVIQRMTADARTPLDAATMCLTSAAAACKASALPAERTGDKSHDDLVDMVSAGSFPASDAPPWTLGRSRKSAEKAEKAEQVAH